MDYKVSIKEYCNNLGLNLVGFTHCRSFDELRDFFTKRKEKGIENEFEESNIERRVNPFIYMEDGKTIISIAFPYGYESKNNELVYFSKYTRGEDYHQVVSKYLKKICSFIQGFGGDAIYFVDSTGLPERYIAYLCGIGFIGKNGMLITEEYGSYVFLGEIITNLEIQADKPMLLTCENCNLCIEACPTKSILKEQNNPNICLSYITQKKDVEDKWFKLFNGRLFGCDTCQEVCPRNKEVKFSTLKEFKPKEHMENPNIKELVNINKKDFNEKYKITSCGWRGKNIIQRNALINLSNKNNMDENSIKNINSSYVKEYYFRLLKNSNL
ncbi:epoxyqueuosine reductase [Clostridium homopropionicum DSM 5847]|uniref:Epoxyqueuosine reductase n=1 Tax=Clostridium homopropionicum DSM 5847 TaxID=1121318 RepID=A0A0L6ZCQ5_9CLOT|nr:tRNA epoxyqueuosine(34) reductase QueG [Clostridium homopropionicum]KOA20759.1 epoxyqueuosine reductase [Clostridium homopropionicum DSM 5847]SFF89757.1 epoxyqueuosine reductase [Clostridium homopropionicum]